MKAYADTVVNALHVLLTRSPQIFDYLTLVDGDDLLRLTHGGFIQTALLFEMFFVKHFSLKKASNFPVFIKGFSLLLAGTDQASRRMRACSIR